MSTREQRQFIDLSHVVEHGMVTYKGLPAPLISDLMVAQRSVANHPFKLASSPEYRRWVLSLRTAMPSAFLCRYFKKVSNIKQTPIPSTQ